MDNKNQIKGNVETKCDPCVRVCSCVSVICISVYECVMYVFSMHFMVEKIIFCLSVHARFRMARYSILNEHTHICRCIRSGIE